MNLIGSTISPCFKNSKNIMKIGMKAHQVLKNKIPSPPQSKEKNEFFDRILSRLTTTVSKSGVQEWDNGFIGFSIASIRYKNWRKKCFFLTHTLVVIPPRHSMTKKFRRTNDLSSYIIIMSLGLRNPRPSPGNRNMSHVHRWDSPRAYIEGESLGKPL